MSKTRYVLTITAGNYLCPITPVMTSDTALNKCQGDGCMLWIDADGTRINKGGCGLLGGEAKRTKISSIYTRILLWLS